MAAVIADVSSVEPSPFAPYDVTSTQGRGPVPPCGRGHEGNETIRMNVPKITIFMTTPGRKRKRCTANLAHSMEDGHRFLVNMPKLHKVQPTKYCVGREPLQLNLIEANQSLRCEELSYG